MNQVLSAYPAGASGAALFMLRLSVAASIVMTTFSEAYLWAIGLALAGLLLVGAGARAMAAVCTVMLCAIAVLAGARALSLAGPILASCALALSGPGAFSIDALRFGRRTIHLTRRQP